MPALAPLSAAPPVFARHRPVSCLAAHAPPPGEYHRRCDVSHCGTGHVGAFAPAESSAAANPARAQPERQEQKCSNRYSFSPPCAPGCALARVSMRAARRLMPASGGSLGGHLQTCYAR